MKPVGELELRLQPVTAPPSVEPMPAGRPVELQADWPRIFADLTSLGLVEIEVGNPLASLTCLCEPWSAHIDGHFGRINGPGLGMVAVVDGLAAATIESGRANVPAEQQLRWYDWGGHEVLRLALTEESAWSRFRSLLVRQWSQPATPRAVPDEADRVVIDALQHKDFARLGWSDPELSDAWYLRRHEGDRHWLCRQGSPVDPTLMAPFLEAIADQNCALRILVGNGSVLQQHETEFHDCRITDGALILKGPTASMRLRHTDAAAACIVEYQGDGPVRRQIRLVDECQRTIVSVAAVADEYDADPALWQTLVNALRD